jgi:hypothetical protein
MPSTNLIGRPSRVALVRYDVTHAPSLVILAGGVSAAVTVDVPPEPVVLIAAPPEVSDKLNVEPDLLMTK